MERTKRQIDAKSGAISSYNNKGEALQNQIEALEKEWVYKRQQLEGKIRQADLKIKSQEADLKQREADDQIADFQLARTDTLYQMGIKSLNDRSRSN